MCAAPVVHAGDAYDPGYDGRREPAYEEPRYRERYDEPVPPRGSVKDGYPIPQGPQAYAAAPPPPGPRCLSKVGIQQALHEQGWRDFDNVEVRGDMAFMNARGDSGRRYELRIDSCNGEVLNARPEYVRVPDRYVDYYPPRPVVGFYAYGGYGPRYRWRHR